MTTAETTQQKIEKALSIMKSHDWYWRMADYTNPAYGNAYGSMRAFVEIVTSINDKAIVKALRDLWTITYNYIHATMWSADKKAKVEFETAKAQLMATIQPQYEMAA